MFGHKRLIEQYEARLKEKEEHILTLKKQVEDLKTLVLPKNSATDIPLVAREADAILTVREEVVELRPDEISKADLELRERDRIFAGEYEEGLPA